MIRRQSARVGVVARVRISLFFGLLLPFVEAVLPATLLKAYVGLRLGELADLLRDLGDDAAQAVG